ncbi:leucine carboxyl methyltransferase [Penicillium capsulatum]|uniref:tRNA wybutosine-synthesizing protein 4 n=1 Tax=Penicillium capsulatum TaxID=69766 RepID=A0A9W9HQ58_9EURO|nr:leucine carboxyl methyltransferase [Penicillium capsulatum]
MAPPRPAVATASKAEQDADVVMGTNNSSIASKRSVEMIYYPQPHFFRYFVKKPQRRSPIINRGYWLRMHAMAETVRQFMEKAPADKPKYVLNLGCGYDPLPFILLSDEQKSMRRGHTIFVDIDYEKLMVHKKNAIRQTAEITKVIGDVEFGSDVDAIQIRSPRYLAVGCDLKNMTKLDDVLRHSILPSEDCSVLFLAEVSLTYMDVKSANDVVTWASRLTSDVQFYILEQFFPDGPDHPFAKTMMSHFHKLRAPLFSIHEFPSLEEQEHRFKKAGWASAWARSLWDLWSDSTFLPESVRTGLDEIEAFDEWEEFALFASHYFLLIASNGPEVDGSIKPSSPTEGSGVSDASGQYVLEAHCLPDRRGRRRYGALVPDQMNTIGIHGGQGEQARLATTDLYRQSETSEPQAPSPSRDIPTRMCHTITPLNANDCLLVGGRTSPTAPLGDCWLRQGQTWRQIHPLPKPRFRQNATDVVLGGGTSSILVYGGKSNDNVILDNWVFWNEQDERGWQTVVPVGPKPEARFGASFSKINENSGVLFGGIGCNGTILEDIWTWSLSRCGDGSLQVELTDITQRVRDASPHLFSYLTRFGATVNAVPQGLVIAGGIMPRQLVPADKEILLLATKDLLHTTPTTPSSNLISTIGLGNAFTGTKPLLTGHVAHTIDQDQVLFLGGGAVCFSFGTCWSEGTWLLKPRNSHSENLWAITAPKKEVPIKTITRPTGNKTRGTMHDKTELATIPRVRIDSAAQFEQTLARGTPVVIEGSDIGPCTQRWTKEYLTSAVGQDRKVVVHAAQTEQMNFQSKNFDYVTKSFGEFLDEVHAGGRQYLRSISADQPSKLPASLASDFPTLQEDFHLPGSMAQVTDNMHSSPLRISGPVTMWLHYDVMANVLCQVRGERRLRLFPPDDSAGLDAAASIPGTSPQEAVLRPGDILFIPPLWSHAACSATSDVSVAVNVFFRNLTKGYATGRDVYGNRDLHAYEKSRQDLQRVARSFDGIPPDMSRFYLRRLAQELQELADQ